MDQATIESAFELLIEGHTKSEIRARLGIDRNEWNALLDTPKLRKMFEAPVSSALGLIHEIETELFEALAKSLDKTLKLSLEQREALHKRINNLEHRYTTFIVPKVIHKADK